MLVASLTTSNEAWGRNPHVPKGFVAARGRPRRCRSSAMTHIAVVAAPGSSAAWLLPDHCPRNRRKNVLPPAPRSNLLFLLMFFSFVGA